MGQRHNLADGHARTKVVDLIRTKVNLTPETRDIGSRGGIASGTSRNHNNRVLFAAQLGLPDQLLMILKEFVVGRGQWRAQFLRRMFLGTQEAGIACDPDDQKPSDGPSASNQAHPSLLFSIGPHSAKSDGAAKRSSRPINTQALRSSAAPPRVLAYLFSRM
jgi:hypothetical protein